MSSGRRLVFVTWDGPRQPYLKSLFLPLLRGLTAHGWSPEVLQFCWGPQPELTAADLNVTGHHIRVSQVEVSRRFFPLLYPWQMARGARVLSRHLEPEGRTVVVARSHLPAAIALTARAMGAKFELIFDIDGLMPDERADIGAWKRNGPMHRIFLRIEQAACAAAAVTVTRSEGGRRILLDRQPGLHPDRVVAVPNGRDPALFRPASIEERQVLRHELGFADGTAVVVYAGSLGPQYLPEEMARFVGSLSQRVEDLRWLVLSPMQRDVEALLSRHRQLRAKTVTRAVSPLEVPRFLAACDLGLALRSASPSQAAVSPVKVGEYLLCGLPVLSSRHIGDLDAQLEGTRCCRLVENGDPAELESAVAWAAELLSKPRRARPEPDESRARGLEAFALDGVVARYAAVLASSAPK